MLESDLTVATLFQHYADVRKRLMGKPEAAKEIAVQQPPKPEPEPKIESRPKRPPRAIRIEHPPVDLIMDEVNWFYGVRKTDVISQRRNKNVVIPRHVGMYLCRRLTLCSLPEIGRRFGGRDHTTVMHACEKIEGKMEFDGDLAKDIETIESHIKKSHAILNEAAA